MLNQFSRTALLLGQVALNKLKTSKVAVFGIGGVGAYTAEALARSGVYNLTLIDDDLICLTNINRQLIATCKTVGKSKTDIMRRRILEINPRATVISHECFYNRQTASDFNLGEYDYVVDAIDTISSKLDLIQSAQDTKTRIISCMGVGNKLNPLDLKVKDI
jgi:tRNA A37 threonylcarbamoyladenosine dehydratase